ncbi:putative sec-independent protein translocase protein TatA/B/E [Helianthus anomalus]
MAISSAAMTLSLHYTPSVPNRTSLSSSFFINNTFKPLTLAHGSMNKKKKKRSFSCNCLFGLGVPELVVIAGVVALVFGPKKLPEVGRSIGKTVKSFQQ